MAISPRTCFVVMGFGEKTDFATQRNLDLEKSFRVIIKPAVEAAGLTCIRADNVVHSGVIDKPMYEHLLDADVVVADLSTSNANAIYELGVRHALRPNTTIVIAESQFRFPFDLNHVLIRHYEHLGKGIDAEEAERARYELQKALETLVARMEVDSPVYTFLPDLQPPSLERSPSFEGTRSFGTRSAPVSFSLAASEETDQSTSALMEEFRRARAASDFVTAKALLEKLRERMPKDPYVIQQLALATYKSRLPTVEASLLKAREILEWLRPRESTDAETLGLWGAVHKRLWEAERNRERLDEAVWAYEKCFYFRNDTYAGINLAYLLNVRSSLSAPDEAIADFVLAERVRRSVLRICEERLAAGGVKDDEGNVNEAETFWLRATLAEARLGIGDAAGAEAERAIAVAQAPEDWMVESMEAQLASLQRLLEASPRRFIVA